MLLRGAALKPAWSLVSFLAHHEMQGSASAGTSTGTSGLSEPPQRAVVQAILNRESTQRLR
jgi:hypothetical protein